MKKKLKYTWLINLNKTRKPLSMTDTNVLKQLKLNEFRDEHEKRKCLNQIIEIAKEECLSLCRAGMCDFICDLVRSEKSVDCMTSLCVLIGYLGLKDKYRPVLFANDVANIIIHSLDSVEHIKDKLDIINAIRSLCQTKNDAGEFIKAGLIPHLCGILKCVETNKDKQFVSNCIFWVSYLASDKTTALQHGCIELMYKAAESISNKPIQSNIFCDINYYDINPTKYPIYELWKTNFQRYCDETVH